MRRLSKNNLAAEISKQKSSAFNYCKFWLPYDETSGTLIRNAVSGESFTGANITFPANGVAFSFAGRLDLSKIESSTTDSYAIISSVAEAALPATNLIQLGDAVSTGQASNGRLAVGQAISTVATGSTTTSTSAAGSHSDNAICTTMTFVKRGATPVLYHSCIINGTQSINSVSFAANQLITVANETGENNVAIGTAASERARYGDAVFQFPQSLGVDEYDMYDLLAYCHKNWPSGRKIIPAEYR